MWLLGPLVAVGLLHRNENVKTGWKWGLSVACAGAVVINCLLFLPPLPDGTYQCGRSILGGLSMENWGNFFVNGSSTFDADADVEVRRPVRGPGSTFTATFERADRGGFR